MEKGLKLEPYQGSLSESPALPVYPPISSLYCSRSEYNLKLEYSAYLRQEMKSFYCCFKKEEEKKDVEFWVVDTNFFFFHRREWDTRCGASGLSIVVCLEWINILTSWLSVVVDEWKSAIFNQPSFFLFFLVPSLSYAVNVWNMTQSLGRALMAGAPCKFGAHFVFLRFFFYFFLFSRDFLFYFRNWFRTIHAQTRLGSGRGYFSSQRFLTFSPIPPFLTFFFLNLNFDSRNHFRLNDLDIYLWLYLLLPSKSSSSTRSE